MKPQFLRPRWSVCRPSARVFEIARPPNHYRRSSEVKRVKRQAVQSGTVDATQPLSSVVRPSATSNSLTAGTSMANTVNPYAALTTIQGPRVSPSRKPVIE